MDGLLFFIFLKTFHELEELAINLSQFEGRKIELFTMLFTLSLGLSLTL
jgi:hypothetical protein